MKTNSLLPIAALGLAGLVSSAFAQASGTVTNAADAAPPAPAEQATQTTPTPNQIVYRATLPSAQDLTNAAASSGLTVDQITQNAGQVTAVYKTKSRQVMTVAYVLLPAANGVTQSTATIAPTTTYTPPSTVVVTQPAVPATTVVYTDPYYYDYTPWYYGYGWGYPGIALGIGVGGYWYHGHYYHGYPHGGYHHGGGWAHPGGGHPGHVGSPGRPGGGSFHTGGGFHH
jgi:hypothetical protein